MDRTQLIAVERNGHWTVCIIWSNGKKAYFGKYDSEREAERWIEQHKWMTTEAELPLPPAADRSGR
jgi:hypothetical protein